MKLYQNKIKYQFGKSGQRENKYGQKKKNLDLVSFTEFGHNIALSFLATEVKKTCPATQFTVDMASK